MPSSIDPTRSFHLLNHPKAMGTATLLSTVAGIALATVAIFAHLNGMGIVTVALLGSGAAILVSPALVSATALWVNRAKQLKNRREASPGEGSASSMPIPSSPLSYSGETVEKEESSDSGFLSYDDIESDNGSKTPYPSGPYGRPFHAASDAERTDTDTDYLEEETGEKTDNTSSQPQSSPPTPISSASSRSVSTTAIPDSKNFFEEPLTQDALEGLYRTFDKFTWRTSLKKVVDEIEKNKTSLLKLAQERPSSLIGSNGHMEKIYDAGGGAQSIRVKVTADGDMLLLFDGVNHQPPGQVPAIKEARRILRCYHKGKLKIEEAFDASVQEKGTPELVGRRNEAMKAEAENLEVIERIRQSGKPGAEFFLETSIIDSSGKLSFVSPLLKPLEEKGVWDKFTPQEKINILIKACQALKLLHEYDVSDNDFKLGNLLFEPATGDPRLIDFDTSTIGDIDPKRTTLYIWPRKPDSSDKAELYPKYADLYALAATMVYGFIDEFGITLEAYARLTEGTPPNYPLLDQKITSNIKTKENLKLLYQLIKDIKAKYPTSKPQFKKGSSPLVDTIDVEGRLKAIADSWEKSGFGESSPSNTGGLGMPSSYYRKGNH